MDMLLLGTAMSPIALIVILIIALLVFGKRLPDVARSIGKGIVEFKKGVKGIEEDIDRPLPPPSQPYYQPNQYSQPQYGQPQYNPNQQYPYPGQQAAQGQPGPQAPQGGYQPSGYTPPPAGSDPGAQYPQGSPYGAPPQGPSPGTSDQGQRPSD